MNLSRTASWFPVAATLFITSPAYGTTMEIIEATVEQCQTTNLCHCPKGEITLLKMEDECGPGPRIDLDDKGNWTNKVENDRYSKCQLEVLDHNQTIGEYNTLARSCQKRHQPVQTLHHPPELTPSIGSSQTTLERYLEESGQYLKQSRYAEARSI